MEFIYQKSDFYSGVKMESKTAMASTKRRKYSTPYLPPAGFSRINYLNRRVGNLYKKVGWLSSDCSAP